MPWVLLTRLGLVGALAASRRCGSSCVRAAGPRGAKAAASHLELASARPPRLAGNSSATPRRKSAAARPELTATCDRRKIESKSMLRESARTRNARLLDLPVGAAPGAPSAREAPRDQSSARRDARSFEKPAQTLEGVASLTVRKSASSCARKSPLNAPEELRALAQRNCSSVRRQDSCRRAHASSSRRCAARQQAGQRHHRQRSSNWRSER